MKAKKKKRNPSKKGKPQQRTKKWSDLITIRNDLYGTDVELTITATPENWRRLHGVSGIIQRDFWDRIFRSFIFPVYDEKLKEPEPKIPFLRGDELTTRGEKQRFMLIMKVQAAVFFQFHQYWVRIEQMPEPLIIKMSKDNDEWEDEYSRTVSSMNELYGRLFEKHTNRKFKPEDENFRVTYLAKGETILKRHNADAAFALDQLTRFSGDQWIKKSTNKQLDKFYSLCYNINLSCREFLFGNMTGDLLIEPNPDYQFYKKHSSDIFSSLRQ